MFGRIMQRLKYLEMKNFVNFKLIKKFKILSLSTKALGKILKHMYVFV